MNLPLPPLVRFFISTYYGLLNMGSFNSYKYWIVFMYRLKLVVVECG